MGGRGEPPPNQPLLLLPPSSLLQNQHKTPSSLPKILLTPSRMPAFNECTALRIFLYSFEDFFKGDFLVIERGRVVALLDSLNDALNDSLRGALRDEFNDAFLFAGGDRVVEGGVGINKGGGWMAALAATWRRVTWRNPNRRRTRRE